MRFSFARVAGLFVLVALSQGCASTRSVSVGSDTPTYSVDVTNQMSHTIWIHWSDGGSTKHLGSVGGGRTERLIVAGAKSASVTFTANDANNAHTRTYPVTLAAGSTQKITVR